MAFDPHDIFPRALPQRQIDLNTLCEALDSSEDIPVVYTIELSSQKVVNAIAETTGARVLTFHSCQTLTRQEFDGGETYLSLMWKNVDVLKEGLA